jgi:GPH family glycoside/pentoside/hexuronide:cation symporter
VGIAATTVRVFMPYSFMATLIAGPIVTLGTIPMMAMGGVLLNNTVEYGEWLRGHRLVGMANSVSSFSTKIGTGVGGALVGWVLAAGAYDGTAAAQLPSALNAIIALAIWLPGIFMALIYLGLRFYDLDAKYPQIIADLAERQTATEELR